MDNIENQHNAFSHKLAHVLTLRERECDADVMSYLGVLFGATYGKCTPSWQDI